MNNILVAGGAGFIGSNFINLLLKQGLWPNSIVCVDKLTYAGRLNNINNFEQFKHFYQLDINNTKNILKIIDKHSINIIVNFAAETHVDNSILTPAIFTISNVLGTNNLLECAKLSWKNDYNDKKFIQVSTDEVYGSLAENNSTKFTEESSIEPHSPYSASKAAADLLALSYFHTYKFPVIVTRCSNNYGKNQHKEKLIPMVIHKALQNQLLPIYGDGMNVRDWIYVEDHCKALLEVMQNGTIGEVYNIGADCEKTNLEIVNTILDILKKPASLIEFVPDRPGHDRRYAVNASKIRHELGWAPSHSFEENILSTVQWYEKEFKI